MRADVIVVGAGAAGLMAAIAAARARPTLRVVCLDGARTIGAKILVSGGSRCNVTNRVVTPADFWGGSRRHVKTVLDAFPADRTVEFFADIGVRLTEEAGGKLFPTSGRSRTVLDALVAECARAGVETRPGRRVSAIRREVDTFCVTAAGDEWVAGAVVLACGGRALPKSGSDGFGYELARRLGHGCVETTPALVPLTLSGDLHGELSGVSQIAELYLPNGRRAVRLRGPLLWTHFGISGPVVLDMSRHWLRATLDGEAPFLRASLRPGLEFADVEQALLTAARERPRAALSTVVGEGMPSAVAAALVRRVGIEPSTALGQLERAARRTLVHTLLELPLAVVGSRGYTYAEATAGGIPLDEIDVRTMGSRRCPQLYLAGEMLDVDGRLGGFNFQWAWSSGYVAGTSAARRWGG